MSIPVKIEISGDVQRVLRKLAKQLGCSQSQVIREGILLLAGMHLNKPTPRITGAGKFRSGISNLGSSKKHLDGFGS